MTMANLIEVTQCYLTENDCYKSTRTIKPEGICVHSTGANNKNIARYVQPSALNTQKKKLLETIGTNKYANDWNHPNIQKCVHAFIGLGAQGQLMTVQTLPWTKRGWHAGSGKNGSLNNTHIGFEICEDNLADRDYFHACMLEAQKLCAWLCKKYKLNPAGQNVIVCHSEGYRLGKASNHGDIETWLKRFGLNMIWFREKVIYYYNKEDNEMDEKVSVWAQEAVDWAVKNKLTNGVNVQNSCSKEELLTILYRYDQMKASDNHE